MSIEQNRAVVRRLWKEVLEGGNLGVVDEIVATNVVDHDRMPELKWQDCESTKRWATTLREALPDLRVSIEDQVCEGDRVCSRVVLQGTRKGPMMGIPPSGKPFTIHGMVIMRVSNGKIVEVWPQRDDLGMMVQLGVVNLPGPAKA